MAHHLALLREHPDFGNWLWQHYLRWLEPALRLSTVRARVIRHAAGQRLDVWLYLVQCGVVLIRQRRTCLLAVPARLSRGRASKLVVRLVCSGLVCVGLGVDDLCALPRRRILPERGNRPRAMSVGHVCNRLGLSDLRGLSSGLLC